MVDQERNGDCQAGFDNIRREPGALSDAIDDSRASKARLKSRSIRWLRLATRPLLDEPAKAILLKRLEEPADAAGTVLQFLNESTGNLGVIRIRRSASHGFNHIQKTHHPPRKVLALVAMRERGCRVPDLGLLKAFCGSYFFKSGVRAGRRVSAMISEPFAVGWIPSGWIVPGMLTRSL